MRTKRPVLVVLEITNPSLCLNHLHDIRSIDAAPLWLTHCLIDLTPDKLHDAEIWLVVEHTTEDAEIWLVVAHATEEERMPTWKGCSISHFGEQRPPEDIIQHSILWTQPTSSPQTILGSILLIQESSAGH